MNAPVRKEETHAAAEGGNEQSFGQQLPDDAETPGSEGAANGHLLPPSGRARQQQAGHIGTSNHEHKGDRRHDQGQAVPNAETID